MRNAVQTFFCFLVSTACIIAPSIARAGVVLPPITVQPSCSQLGGIDINNICYLQAGVGTTIGDKPAIKEDFGLSGYIGYYEVSLPSLQIIPKNPNNNTPVTCDNDAANRQAYASNELGPHILSLSIGDLVRISYPGGQTEVFVIECRRCSLPAQPLPNTCG